jgi:glutamate---cysteine ligase / carboxylate-amine ligase
MHYGLDADVLDFGPGRRLSVRKSIRDLLDFVDGVTEDLGSRKEMNYLCRLLAGPRGMGTDRQIAVYETDPRTWFAHIVRNGCINIVMTL